MPDRRKIDPEVFLTQINAILFQIWQKPFGSVSDLQRSPDLNGLSRTTLTDRLDWLETRDYIGSETVGWVRKRRRRFFLHSKGIYRVMGQRGIPLDWAATESALWILRHQLPALETLYTVAPDWWSAGGVASAEPGVWQLDRLKLLGKGTTLALAEYGRRDRTSQVGERRVVAYVWYGLRSPKGSVAKDLHSLLTTLPEPKPAVCGVVILATDRFAGMCARMDLDPELRRAIVTVDGEVVQSLDDAIPSGPITSIRELGMEMGSPENLTARVVEDPSLSALKRQTDYTILRVHEEWNGSDEESVVSLCGHGRSAVRKITTLLEDAGLLERDGKTVYPADGLRTLSEKRDRLDQRRIRGRAGAERDSSGTRRRRMKLHDTGVGRLAVRFRQEGMASAVGWRRVVRVQSRTQITPDLWVLIPLGNNTAVWHAVEYERSATTYESIEKKLRPYIVAHLLGEAWPMLMVCDTPNAARIVAEVAERYDLPLLVGTMDEVMRSPWSGSDSPWRLVGKTVAVDHLRNLAMWNRDKAIRMNYLLRERTDVRL